ncbi:MAG: 30S ribosomal protein S4e [Nitrososphaerota archaeon]|nr:30S ribosomal protein S4e [Candidatus Bathyarchaeota archaeon]MDW8048279.1 30S ribosomal protein S4e [Nitrososphaerota archaeon]
MKRKGGGGHLKREVAPGFWPIRKKEAVWSVKPIPGPHPISRCIPIALIVRDMLGLAQTRKEVKKIVSQGKILVDGRPIRDDRFPAGLMDVISIPEIEKNFRVLPSKKGLSLHPIPQDEAGFKICRIENKTTLKEGHIQLNLHDGRNILICNENTPNPIQNEYETLDTLAIALPNQEILEHFKIGEGMFASVIGGENIGKFGTVTSIIKETGRKRRRWLVTLRNSGDETFQTILDYVFIIGDKKPKISIPSLEGD